MLIDDLRMPLTEEEMKRRKFLGLMGSCCLAAACAGGAAATAGYMRPNVLFEESSRVKLLRPEDLPKGTVLPIPDRKLFLVHDEHGIYALSAVCTHLGCVTNYEKASNRILCPCHGSFYNTEGHVLGGPAPRSLPRVELTLEHGVIVADTRKFVASDFTLKV